MVVTRKKEFRGKPIFPIKKFKSSHGALTKKRPSSQTPVSLSKQQINAALSFGYTRPQIAQALREVNASSFFLGRTVSVRVNNRFVRLPSTLPGIAEKVRQMKMPSSLKKGRPSSSSGSNKTRSSKKPIFFKPANSVPSKPTRSPVLSLTNIKHKKSALRRPRPK